jgi:hypothetical protein
VPPHDTAADEVLGQVVVGDYTVSVHRHAGAVVEKAGTGNGPVATRRLSMPTLPSLPDSPALLDRDIELAAVQALLHASPPPIVEISGRVGVGKTALVRCLTGVLYIDAAGLRYRAFLQHLYERAFHADIAFSPSVEFLRELFSAWDMPVVIDGFEGTAAELHTILDILKRVPVVYTTIEPIRLDPSVAELRLSGLRPDAARELFERSFGASIADDPEAMEFVNIVLEGNPLLIGHAAALARAGALVTLQAPEPLAALTFSNMTIGEQQIFAVIAAFGSARPDRAVVEAVSEVLRASSVINALISRRILQTDGDHVWISPLMRPMLSAGLGLIRYEVMFRYADAVLSQASIPQSIIDNARPMLVMLRLAEAKGYHGQVARNARVLADAFLLGGKIDAAREACELVRVAGNEVFDSEMQAWAQHQIGTLSVLGGDVDEGFKWLQSAELLRDHMGDVAGKLHSQNNAALLRKTPGKKVGKKKVRVVWDVAMISWAVGLSAIVALGEAFGLSSPPSLKATHAHKHSHSHMGYSHMQASRKGSIPIASAVKHVELAAVIAPPIKLAAAAHAIVRRHQPVTHAMKSISSVPRVARFTASAHEITVGASTALCFKLSNATSAFLEPVGKINAHSGCVSDAPRMNTYYTLYAYNQNGMASASVYVDVQPPPARRALPPAQHQPDGLRVP